MGFTKSRQKGSHIQYVGFIKKTKRRVTLIAKQTHFAPKTMRSMIEQSGLSEKDWLSFI
jgi:predicted RNA binding protein YcfA (HicA-like mRNA interferase family)